MESSESYASEAPTKVGTVEVDSCEYELFSKGGNLHAVLSSVKSEDSSLTIPASVESDGNTYVVIGIAPRALRQTHVEVLDFASDSQVKLLGKDALYCHTLKKATLPASLETLATGWCNFTLKLVDLSVSITPIRLSFIMLLVTQGNSSFQLLFAQSVATLSNNAAD